MAIQKQAPAGHPASPGEGVELFADYLIDKAGFHSGAIRGRLGEMGVLPNINDVLAGQAEDYEEDTTLTAVGNATLALGNPGHNSGNYRYACSHAMESIDTYLANNGSTVNRTTRARYTRMKDAIEQIRQGAEGLSDIWPALEPNHWTGSMAYSIGREEDLEYHMPQYQQANQPLEDIYAAAEAFNTDANFDIYRAGSYLEAFPARMATWRSISPPR